jgi:propanol-preferring alcohol dehydrogenase
LTLPVHDPSVRAVVLHRFGNPLVLEERPEPRAKASEVIVRVRGAGICHTDVQLAAGR